MEKQARHATPDPNLKSKRSSNVQTTVTKCAYEKSETTFEVKLYVQEQFIAEVREINIVYSAKFRISRYSIQRR